ncbi:hypothetical protein HRbin02_01811 [Candidatus Calditenuaceae archaeon HR02]|nr:hypothetical protein HRbin02_01811 [Candidatus Calditenuaceae archaeon HR02]
MRRAILIPVVGAVSLMAALVVVFFTGVAAQSTASYIPVHGGFWWRHGWRWWNATVETTEVSRSGQIVDAQGWAIVLASGQESYELKVPVLVDSNGNMMSLTKVFFEDLIRKNDRLEISATKVTVTRSDGTSYSLYILRSLRDSDTGFEVWVPNYRLPPQGSATGTSGGQSA